MVFWLSMLSSLAGKALQVTAFSASSIHSSSDIRLDPMCEFCICSFLFARIASDNQIAMRPPDASGSGVHRNAQYLH